MKKKIVSAIAIASLMASCMAGGALAKPSLSPAIKQVAAVKKPAAKKKISDPSAFSYKVDSADGVKVYWKAINNTGKTINYYTIHLSTFNPVGDPSYDELTGESSFTIKYVGPVKNGEEMVAYHVFTYQATLTTIKINKIDLVYSDGKKETITYSYKTGKITPF